LLSWRCPPAISSVTNKNIDFSAPVEPVSDAGF